MTSGVGVRLYVGGLPPNISSKQVASRFASFGSTSAVELVPSKQHGEVGCRGFAYLEFIPNDDQSLHRCLSLYNGCKWLGGVLRVEKAKAHYLTRLKTEWEAKLESQEQIEDCITTDELSVQQDPMRIPTPASGFVKRKLMVVRPGPVKRIFAPYKGERLSTLSWDAPPTPPGVRKRKAAEMAAAAFVSQPSAQQQLQQQTDVHHGRLPGPPLRTSSMADNQQSVPEPSPLQVVAQKPAEEEVPQQEAAASESSSDEGVVDFMSDDDMAVQAEVNVDQTSDLEQHNRLSRFDDSEDNQPVLQQASCMPAAAAPAHAAASTAAAATDLSRFGDSEDDETPAFQGTNQQAAITAAADDAAAAAAASAAAKDPDLSRFNDSDTDDQPQTQVLVSGNDEMPQSQSNAQQQAPLMFAAAAPDLSRLNDSDGDVLEPAAAPSRGPGTTAAKLSSAPLPMVSKEGKVTKPDVADQAASQQAPSLASESAPSSESALSSQHPSSSDGHGSIAQESGMHNILSSKPAPHQQRLGMRSTLAATEQQGQPLKVDGELQADADMESETESGMSSDYSLAQSSDNSDAVLNSRDAEQSVSNSDDESSLEASDSQLEVDRPDWQEAVHNAPLRSAVELNAQLASEEEGSASEASGDPIQEDALQATASAPNESADLEVDDSAPVGSATAAVQEATMAPLYPDLMTLQAGAAFWSQHKVTSERAWQAERQALHADYKAKHRAAAKHVHKGHRRCLV